MLSRTAAISHQPLPPIFRLAAIPLQVRPANRSQHLFAKLWHTKAGLQTRAGVPACLKNLDVAGLRDACPKQNLGDHEPGIARYSILQGSTEASAEAEARTTKYTYTYLFILYVYIYIIIIIYMYIMFFSKLYRIISIYIYIEIDR